MAADIERNRALPDRARTQYRALFDPLTDLPGPALLFDRLEMAFAHAERARTHVAVFYVPFDWSRRPGENAAPVVRAFTAALRAAVRPEDTVARISDDAFVVVCPDVPYEEDASNIAERLSSSVRDLFRSDDLRSLLETPIGVAVTRHGLDPSQIVEAAKQGLDRGSAR